MDDFILTHNYVRSNIKNKNLNIKKNKNKITRINIDSSYRNKESKNILDNNIIYLDNHPIDIICNNINDTDIVVHNINHPYNVNDNIIICGVKSTNIILKNALIFTDNSYYVCVTHKNHGIDFSSINPITIQINNFQGNINNTSYNNIPINEINRIHTIIPNISSTNEVNIDKYYFKINIISNFNGIYENNISISFKTINGINLNLINANYPKNIDQLNGFQTIYYTEPNLYKFKLNINNNITVYGCGSNNIWTCKVVDFIQGYENNNYYNISLKKTFYNVYRIKLISTEFPNVKQIIRDDLNYKNNNFYWSIYNDGEPIYNISLKTGNYTDITLKETMTRLIKEVPRIIDINNDCNINLDTTTNTFNIEFFSNINLPNCIIFKNGLNFEDNKSRLIITQRNHGLIENCIINISNAISTDGIPETIINSEFKIDKIINNNTYEIILPYYRQLENITKTNGGENIIIRYPIKSQLIFTSNDTIGEILGFKDVGKPNSYTDYNYMNTNKTDYINDIIKENNNIINLMGQRYILMTNNIYNEINNTGNINNIFAKILFEDPTITTNNRYIQLSEYFDPPLNTLSSWETSFYDANGNLYNFGNIEHSYTLEIYEDYES
jgi:hypothetical protein